jgi:molecular chaperone DnaK
VTWTPALRRQFGLEIEAAKVRLSSQDFTNVTLPNASSLRVTRALFDDVTRPLVEKLRRPLEQCIAMSRWDPATIDHVLLVGGTCKIPAVRTLVTELLGRAPTAGVDPMTAIAEGAAVAAAIMTGELDNDFFVSTEHALGTIAIDGNGQPEFSEIIGRGHKLPALGKGTYVPVFDEQVSVRVRVLEGDPSLPVSDDLNVQIAEWDIELPSPDRGDERSLTLEYRYDVEGILHVKALDDFTGSTLLEETVGSKTSRDKRELVKIASAVESSASTGTLNSRIVDRVADPEAEQLLQTARTKVIPFLDDAEASVLRERALAVETASTDAERTQAKQDLRQALGRYSYLL